MERMEQFNPQFRNDNSKKDPGKRPKDGKITPELFKRFHVKKYFKN